MSMILPFDPEPHPRGGWRERFYVTIFGHDTPAGRGFDVLLIVIIIASVAVVLMDSVAALNARHGRLFLWLEWGFTLAFTIEYAIRLVIVCRPLAYARSFYGLIDLLAILPTYLALLFPGAQSLAVVRVLRVLRIWKVLHIRRFQRESSLLLDTLWRSLPQVLIFLLSVLLIVVNFGALMYLIEGPEHGFTSIPVAMYWAVVTVGTVGFGDIAPATPLGQLVASILILIGYGIIVVPAGIYSAELAVALRRRAEGKDERRCRHCDLIGHDADGMHCRRCGTELPPRH